jgi:hypothetical protein
LKIHLSSREEEETKQNMTSGSLIVFFFYLQLCVCPVKVEGKVQMSVGERVKLGRPSTT